MKIPGYLETERLLIRPYVGEDLENLFSLLNDERVTGSTDLPGGQTFEETGEILNIILQSYETHNPIFSMAITRKDDRSVIGYCGLSPFKNKNEAHVYYALSPEYCGRGFATEATSKLMEYVFSEMDMERVVSFIPSQNTESCRVAEKAGMLYDGILKHYNKKGNFFAIGREQYLS